MAGNSFGHIFRISTYGESHGKGIGVVIDGCPAGLSVSEALINDELRRRRPGQSKITTGRNESDIVDIQSGIFEGKTTGTPISLHIKNKDHKSKDYSHIQSAYRPSHADFVYDKKYGIRDYRGGGRSSARETAARVAAGAIAKELLKRYNIDIRAGVTAVGPISLASNVSFESYANIEDNIVRCPDQNVAKKMESLILETKKKGDSIGGQITCIIRNCPAGLGDPVFDKLHADLGKAMLSINAVKGFEYGSGFEGSKMYGSEHNDQFYTENEIVKTKTNFSGGIQGGISNGMDIYFKVAFKPVATIMLDQNSISTDGTSITVKGKGRHDPCVVPRAVPIVEAMAALVIADKILVQNSQQIG